MTKSKKDKIVQMFTIGDSYFYGLSESGKLYELESLMSSRWKLLLDSPELLEETK